VDANVSRTLADGVAVIERLAGSGSLPDVVVVALGLNAGFTQQDVDRMMEVLGPDRTVVVVTIRLSGAYDDIWAANNALLRALPDVHPNVTVFDWDVESARCLGECFQADEIHLTQTGADFYAELLLDAVPD
jgi:hypothetical protein